MTDPTPPGAIHGSGFSARLGFGAAPALLVVDFVKAYSDPAGPLYVGSDAPRAATARLLAAARAVPIQIVHTRVVFDDGPRDGGVFWRKAGGALTSFLTGDPMGDFADGLEPRDAEMVIEKHQASSFHGTALAEALTRLGVDCLIVAGVSTSGCVRASALDACQHGFVPLVVREAVGDRSPHAHEANLADLDAKYADVVALDDVVAWLERLALDPPAYDPAHA